MRTFDLEEAAIAIELEQMVTDYWREVDFNGGSNATDYFTEDVEADFGAIKFSGHEGVRKYYADRQSLIRKEQEDGIRTTRHVFQNLQVIVESSERATLNFLIITHGGSGRPPVLAGTLPVSISDTRFECRREADGQWRVFGFYGEPIFIGEEAFARKALTGSRI